MLELTEELKKRGHDLTIITTWPEYNLEGSKSRKYLEKENGKAMKKKS